MAVHPLQSAIAPQQADASVHAVPASDFLRAYTAQAHRALEKSPVSQCLMASQISAPQYVRVLAKWLACWEPLETVLQSAWPADIDPIYIPTARCALLRLDLQTALRVVGDDSASAKSLAADAFWTDRMQRATEQPGGWFGIAYVAQGALNGGAVIAAHLRRALPPDLAQSTTFFAGHPMGDSPPLAKRWQQWCEWLDAQVTTPEHKLVAAEAAMLAFRSIAHAFTDEGAAVAHP